MLRSETAAKPSSDCVLNAAWPAFVRQPAALTRNHVGGQLHDLPESVGHPRKPQSARRASPSEDRRPALAHWRTDQSA